MDIERPGFAHLFSELDILAASGNNSEQSVRSCFDRIMTAMGSERGFLLLSKGKEIDWKPFAGRGINLDSLFETEAVSKTIIRTVIEGKKSLITTNALADPRFSDKQSVVASEIRSVICAPLMSETGLFGLMYLDNRFSDDFFTEEDRDYLIKCGRKLSKIIAQHLPNACAAS